MDIKALFEEGKLLEIYQSKNPEKIQKIPNSYLNKSKSKCAQLQMAKSSSISTTLYRS
jgi:hypothetical protein